jgi:serine/threonine protein kinase
LKLLAPGLADDETFRARFLRESRMAASLDHPSIVPIFDAGEVDGRLYIAMRYVEGSDLSRLLREEAPLSPERTIALLTPVADALDAAAARGLVHRDVKPSNILLDASGRSYLADFGLSKEASEQGLVESSHFAASVDYVAPEQIAREPVGSAADVYALGCVLFECLTGKPPFGGGSVMSVLFAHVEEQPPVATERNPELPSAVDAVLAKALAKEPDERHATAGELVAEAERALGLVDATPRVSRKLLVGTVAAVLLAAGAVLAIVLALGGSNSAPRLDSLVRIDPATNRVTKRVPLGHGLRDVGLGLGGVWVSAPGESSLWRVEPQTGKTRRVTGLSEPGSVAVVDKVNGAVYVGNYLGVTEVNGNLTPATPVAGLAPVEWNTPPVAAGKLGVWIADSTGPAVRRLALDPNLGATSVILSIPIRRSGDETTGFHALSGIAIGDRAVWVTGDTHEHAVFRVDPVTRTVVRFRLPAAPGPVAAGAGAIWIAGQLDDVVWRVDPFSGRVTDTIPVDAGVSDLAAGPNGIWVSSAIAGTVSRIDPRARQVKTSLAVDGLPQGLAAGAGEVWVATRAA